MSTLDATAPAGNVRGPHLVRSAEIDKIAAALAAAQVEYKPIEKRRTARVRTKAGDTYEYKYADLADVFDATRPALAKHGLVVVQSAATIAEGAAVVVTTLLLHSSGQYFESALIMPVPDQKPQTLGSVITYARRYSLTALLGIMAEEDDDAGVAQDAANNQRGGQQQQQQRGGGGGRDRSGRGEQQQRGGGQQQQQQAAAAPKPIGADYVVPYDWVFEGTEKQVKYVDQVVRAWGMPEHLIETVRKQMASVNVNQLKRVCDEVFNGAQGS